MSYSYQRSGGGVFVRSYGGARNAAFQVTEQMSIGAMLSRNGWIKFVSKNGCIATQDYTVFASLIYLKMSVSVAWPSGNSANIVIAVDPLYGDFTAVTSYSWQDGQTFTNYIFSSMSSNVSFAGFGLAAKSGSGDTDPTTEPDGSLVITDTSATATWADGTVVTAVIDTADLGQKMTLDENVQTCTGLLQWATLLDQYYLPNKNYDCSYAGLPATPIYLRFPSEPKIIGSPNTALSTNQIVIIPSRNFPNGVGFSDGRNSSGFSTAGAWSWIQPASAWPGDQRFQFYAPKPTSPPIPFGGQFCRNLFAYGQTYAYFNANRFATFFAQSINSIISVKTAIRCKKSVAGAIKNSVDNSTGAYAVGSFAPPDINSHSGLLIFDPVAYMPTPPAGYVLDPSNGLYHLQDMELGATNYGSAEWDYI